MVLSVVKPQHLTNFGEKRMNFFLPKNLNDRHLDSMKITTDRFTVY